MRSVFHYTTFLFFFLLFSFTHPLIAQNHSEYVAAEKRYKSKSFEECKSALDKILDQGIIYHDSTLAASYKLYGDLFLKKYDLKETVSKYEIADSIYLGLGKRHAPKRLNVVNKIGICYAQQDNLVMTAKYFQTAYDIAIETFAPDDLNVGKAINNLATVYLYLTDYEKSLEYFNKSIEIKKKFAKNNPVPLANTYENVASIYGQINQMGEAERHLQMAGQLYQKDHEGNVGPLIGYYINMAGFYLENDRVEEAIEQLQLADALPEKHKADKFMELLINKNYGVAFLEKKEYDKALRYFEKTEQMSEKYKVGQKDMALVYTHIASIYGKQKNRDSAMDAMMKARKNMLKLYDKTHKNFLSILQQQIFILLEMGELGKAKELLVDFEANFKLRNESSTNDLLFSNLKMGLLSAQLNCLLLSYKEQGDLTYLEEGIIVAEKVIEYQDQVLESISDNDSKLYFFKNAYANFSSAVYLFLAQYKNNKDEKMLEKAFLLTEKTKHYSLKEARGLRYPKLESAIPAKLVESEKQAKIILNQSISKYENLLDSESDPDEMLALISEIDSLKQLHKSATIKLTKASSLLSSYLNESMELDLEKAKSYLGVKERTYISYFLGSNELIDEDYVFILDNAQLKFRSLLTERDSVDANVEMLIETLSIEFNDDEERLKAFEKPARALYRSLISLLDLENNKGVILNLHQKLHSLPFEVLINNATADFFIQERSIGYAYALNSLLNAAEIPFDKDILVSSPDFSDAGELSLHDLPNNKEEIKEICSLLGANNRQEIKTKQEFQNQIRQHKFNIIHLATHASANHKRGHKSFLAFGNRSADLLYSREIYGLPIYSNLVVLSACESGDGEFVESQGVLGLATAFASSAVQSLVASLWKVNDASTKKVMVDFYKHLKEGDEKDIALRKAKLNYLSTVPPSKQHPYYWAGFVHVGSVDALHFENGVGTLSRTFLWIGILFLGIILSLFFFKKKRAISHV